MDFLGFVLVPGSKRRTSPELRLSVPAGVKSVFVVAGMELERIQTLIETYRPDVIQLHGSEPPELARSIRGAEVWRAFHLVSVRDVEEAAAYPAARIVAAAELGRRILTLQAAEKTSIQTSDDVIQLFRPELELLQHEECWALYLSSSNRIIERQRVSQGGVQGTIVDHRLIVKRALELLATQLILVHNHPSGSAEASDADRHLTSRIAEAAALFDIRLLDHIIISRSDDFSFRSAGLLG